MQISFYGCGAMLLSLVLLLVSAVPTVGAAEVDPAKATEISSEELDKLVAPIALYPDALIAQVLPAATYPVEIIQSHRWVSSNAEKAKKDAKAYQAEVQKQPWAESVRALAGFPQILKKMNDDLDWTVKLGDAFLNQQKGVLDAIQHMRAKAQAAGTLQTSKQQTVVVEKEVIKIVPADPQVIYVPQYNPQVVYVQQPSTTVVKKGHSDETVALTGLLSFGAGLAIGAAFLNKDCDYHHGHVYYHGHSHYHGGSAAVVRGPHGGAAMVRGPHGGGAVVRGYGGGTYHGGGSYHGGRYGHNVKNSGNVNIKGNEINVNVNQGRAGKAWSHDAGHRKGVEYKGKAKERYRASGSTKKRGFRDDHMKERHTRQPSSQQLKKFQKSSSALSGYGRGTSTRRQSERGRSSRASSSSQRSRSSYGGSSSRSGSSKRSSSTSRSSSSRSSRSRGSSSAWGGYSSGSRSRSNSSRGRSSRSGSFGGSRGGGGRGGGRGGGGRR